MKKLLYFILRANVDVKHAPWVFKTRDIDVQVKGKKLYLSPLGGSWDCLAKLSLGLSFIYLLLLFYNILILEQKQKQQKR